MTKSFDMGLFLDAVLTGSHATQQRHVRQAQAMQRAIRQRFGRDNPWSWQLKHFRWFAEKHLKTRSPATRYYYQLTERLIKKRLGKPGFGKSRDWLSENQINLYRARTEKNIDSASKGGDIALAISSVRYVQRKNEVRQVAPCRYCNN